MRISFKVSITNLIPEKQQAIPFLQGGPLHSVLGLWLWTTAPRAPLCGVASLGSIPGPQERPSLSRSGAGRTQAWSSLTSSCREPGKTEGSFHSSACRTTGKLPADSRWVVCESTVWRVTSWVSCPIRNWGRCFIKDKVEPAEKAFRIWRAYGEIISIQTRYLDCENQLFSGLRKLQDREV